jgi:hypothetical protein
MAVAREQQSLHGCSVSNLLCVTAPPSSGNPDPSFAVKLAGTQSQAARACPQHLPNLPPCVDDQSNDPVHVQVQGLQVGEGAEPGSEAAETPVHVGTPMAYAAHLQCLLGRFVAAT